MMTEAWYECVDADKKLTQGDFILDCPIQRWQPGDVEILKEYEEEFTGQSETFTVDVVVMTQACDLEHEKVDNVVLCPSLPLREYHKIWEDEFKKKGQTPSNNSWKKHCKEIREGYRWNFAMLNKFESNNLSTEHRIVNFHEVFTVPREFLESLLKQRGNPRLRLLPPYREHLSQAFARFFMRVGLPMPIEEVWQLTNQ